MPVWLLLLPPDLLRHVVTHIDADDLWPASGACSALRAAARADPRAGQGTRQTSAVQSVAKLEWALVNGCPLDCLSVNAAACGKIDVLERVIALGDSRHEAMAGMMNGGEVLAAVENGHLEMVEHLITHESVEFGFPDIVVQHAARCGRARVLEYLLDGWEFVYGERDEVMGGAIRSGDIDTVEVALRMYYGDEITALPPECEEEDCSSVFVCEAAALGCMEMLNFLLRRAPFLFHSQHVHPGALQVAARRGHLDVLKFLARRPPYAALLPDAADGLVENARERDPFAHEELTEEREADRRRVIEWLEARGWEQA